MKKPVMEALEKVRNLSPKEKATLIERLLRDTDLAEDIRDSLAVVARRRERRLDYEDVARVLKGKGRIR